MSFVERQIDVTIKYYKTGETMKLSGYRVLLEMVAIAGIHSGQVAMRIFGLPLHVIREFIAISPIAAQGISKNSILIEAGNAGETLHTVFSGAIMHSWADFSNPPDVSLVIDASVMIQAALTPAPPVSWKGPISAATVMQTFAAAQGWAFSNLGVNVMLQNPVFNGSLQDQMESCSQQAGISYTVNPNGVLIIYPKGKPPSQPNEVMPIISPSAWMVGYPMLTNNGVNVRSIFLPGVHNGSAFAIEGSQFPEANRIWHAHTVAHTLESQVPNGAWFTDLQGFASE